MVDSLPVNRYKREIRIHHKVLGCYDYMHSAFSGISEYSQGHEDRGGPHPLVHISSGEDVTGLGGILGWRGGCRQRGHTININYIIKIVTILLYS